MLTHSFAKEVISKIKNIYIFRFLILMVSIGLCINNFETYPNFRILFPVLLVMSFSTIMLLKYCLKKMLAFNTQCESLDIFKDALHVLFAPKKNVLIMTIYIIVIIMYFLSLYNLDFIQLNIMGFYILLWGVSTLGMALIAYEIYIRLTFVLFKVASDNNSLEKEYNKYSPPHTDWLQNLHQLSKVLKNASLAMGLLFVFENTMIFWANINKLDRYIHKNSTSIIYRLKDLPLEFWLIWLFVFVAISIAFPVIATLQLFSMKKIIFQIRTIYFNKTSLDYENFKSDKKILETYIFMKIIQNTELSLNEKYLPHKFNKFIVLMASLLTCLLHLTTLYNLFK